MFKKLLAVLGGLTVAAAVIPFSREKNEETGEAYYRALLWDARVTPDPDEEGERLVSINLGFHNPLEEDEYQHYQDELLTSSTPPCDIRLVLPGEPEPEPELVTY